MARSFSELEAQAAAPHLNAYRIVDVREPEEFDGPLGHVPGSELIPLSRLPQSAEALRGRPLLLVCRSGRRSGRACEVLTELGVGDVTNLAGGMIASRGRLARGRGTSSSPSSPSSSSASSAAGRLPPGGVGKGT